MLVENNSFVCKKRRISTFTIRMINIAHHYIKIIPISAFKLHSSSSDQIFI